MYLYQIVVLKISNQSYQKGTHFLSFIVMKFELTNSVLRLFTKKNLSDTLGRKQEMLN